VIEFLRQLITGVHEAWQRLSANARVQIGLSALLTVLLLGGAIFMGTQPQYTQAYSNLEPGETTTMASWLADNNIGYRVTGNGTGIMVPDE
jgi:flagellar M-ring protein FliF